MTDQINVLGVGVSAVNMTTARAHIGGWIRDGRTEYVCVTGVHGVMESQRQEDVKRIHNRAGLVVPDGMPLVWLLKLAGHCYVTRVYGPDLMLAVFADTVATRATHFLYGSSETVLANLQRNLTRRFPNVTIVGALSPPFRALTESEDQEIVERINQSNPDIIWVGLSTPKQERWMAEHRDRLKAPVLIGVGAAFDFHAGLKAQAPRFLQKLGLEWLFRLCTEPRRLWRRYLMNNPAFVALICAQATGLKSYSIER